MICQIRRRQTGALVRLLPYPPGGEGLECEWMIVARTEGGAINAAREIPQGTAICFIREDSDGWEWPDPGATAYILDQRPFRLALDPVAYIEGRKRDLGPYAGFGVKNYDLPSA